MVIQFGLVNFPVVFAALQYLQLSLADAAKSVQLILLYTALECFGRLPLSSRPFKACLFLARLASSDRGKTPSSSRPCSGEF